jgi:hypothetical protein
VTDGGYIGGFFELELPEGRGPWHPDALALSTGRAALRAILEETQPDRVWLPFYACDALLVPMRDAGVPVELYALDERLRPRDLPPPAEGELVVVINYFGLQSSLMEQLARRYGSNCIVDNAQAFFERPSGDHWAFCSARKFFGVPDGSYLYAPISLDLHPPPNPKSDIRHLVNRLAGRQQTAYRQMQRFERQVDGRIRAISPLSARMLAAVDYEAVRRRRRENYRSLHAQLATHNRFHAELPADATPFAYPLLLPEPVERDAIAHQRLFVPTLWEDVIRRRSPSGFEAERDFAERLLPLPIDQRYGQEEMEDAVGRLTKAIGLP